ncbi:MULTISPECIES: M56 family metallopeptidase [Bacillus cereus group]|uniref:Transcriptional regulator n=2 Tax=Bacillus cereus group TaxID=86661 RepID=A0A9W7PZX7_BACCE|nr:M56 family metallopeptidase [Bacillus cereus]KAA6450278.1 transcriptional regulator [Bacillus cereus]KAB2421851.1 M48 family metalloprotease [Bacillus cereus]KAB2503936.1 M48 family metalloprotease [Bacillus cereus]
MIDILRHMSLATIFDWIINTSIMASILVALILCLKVIFRNKLTARWHYIMWFILIVRLLLPWSPDSSYSIYSLLLTGFEPSHSILQPTSEGIAPEKHIETTISNVRDNNVEQPNLEVKDSDNYAKQPEKQSISAYEILSYIWLLGVVCCALITIIVNKNLNQYLQKQRPITDQRVLDILNRCKSEMDIQKDIPLLFAGKLSSPTLVGIRNPKILLTENHISTLDDNQLRFIFYHELAHYKRKDVRVNWIMHHLLILHWFNPILWYASKCIREDQEIACDALALTYVHSEETLEYGYTIIALLEHHSNLYPMPGVANLSKNKSALKRRIKMIKKFNKKSYRWSALGIAIVMGVSTFSLMNAKAEEPVKQIIQKDKVLEKNEALKEEKLDKQSATFNKDTSFFATTNTFPAWVNRSAKEGLTTPLYEKITSNGITISFDEMYVEKSRTYIHFRIEDKHGNLVPYEFDTTELDIYEDGKKDGKQVTNPRYKLPGYYPKTQIKEGFFKTGASAPLEYISNEKLDSLLQYGKDYVKDNSLKELPQEAYPTEEAEFIQLPDLDKTGVLYRMTDKPEGAIQISGSKSYVLPESIKIKLQIDRIGKIKGDWNYEFQVNVDQDKAAKATEIMEEESKKGNMKG